VRETIGNPAAEIIPQAESCENDGKNAGEAEDSVAEKGCQNPGGRNFEDKDSCTSEKYGEIEKNPAHKISGGTGLENLTENGPFPAKLFGQTDKYRNLATDPKKFDMLIHICL